MTTRRMRLAVPMLALLLVACVPSEALAFWGWIEELSGPGPFPYAKRLAIDRLGGCVVKPKAPVTSPPPLPVPPPVPVPRPGATATRPRWTSVFGRGGDEEATADKLECLTDGDRIVAYVSMEFTQAHSKMDARFPEVSFTAYRPILFFRMQESVDIGIGVGFNRFSGNGFPKTEFEGQHFDFWRKSLPVRARFFAPGLKSGSRWRGIQLVLQADYLRGFTTANFMAPAGPNIESGFVSSAFLGIDVLTLARGR